MRHQSPCQGYPLDQHTNTSPKHPPVSPLNTWFDYSFQKEKYQWNERDSVAGQGVFEYFTRTSVVGKVREVQDLTKITVFDLLFDWTRISEKISSTHFSDICLFRKPSEEVPGFRSAANSTWDKCSLTILLAPGGSFYPEFWISQRLLKAPFSKLIYLLETLALNISFQTNPNQPPTRLLPHLPVWNDSRTCRGCAQLQRRGVRVVASVPRRRVLHPFHFGSWGQVCTERLDNFDMRWHAESVLQVSDPMRIVIDSEFQIRWSSSRHLPLRDSLGQLASSRTAMGLSMDLDLLSFLPRLYVLFGASSCSWWAFSLEKEFESYY